MMSGKERQLNCFLLRSSSSASSFFKKISSPPELEILRTPPSSYHEMQTATKLFDKCFSVERRIPPPPKPLVSLRLLVTFMVLGIIACLSLECAVQYNVFLPPDAP